MLLGVFGLVSVGALGFSLINFFDKIDLSSSGNWLSILKPFIISLLLTVAVVGTLLFTVKSLKVYYAYLGEVNDELEEVVVSKVSWIGAGVFAFGWFVVGFIPLWRKGIYFFINDLASLQDLAICLPGVWVSMDMYMCYRRLKVLRERLTPLDEIEFGDSNKESDFEN